MTYANLSLIVAAARRGVIGRENALPFRLKDDMKHFVQTTMGKRVLMGRKTFESILHAIGKPLPGRESYVLTRDPSFQCPGVSVFHDVKAACAAIETSEAEWVVIGGAEIYRQFLPYVDRIFLTEVDADVEGDAVFPSLNWAEWERQEIGEYPQNERNEYPFRVLELRRKNGKNSLNA